MLMKFMMISIFMYFMGLMSFSLKRKHLLMMLLSLEMIVLSLFLNMMIYLSYLNGEYYFSLIFLTMSVCEGALGLSLLVSLMRVYGNDYLKSFNLLW